MKPGRILYVVTLFVLAASFLVPAGSAHARNLMPAAPAASPPAWTSIRVDSGGEYVSLRLDGNGVAHLGYYDSATQDLKYARWNGSGWDIQPVDTAGDVGQHCALALAADGTPHISYFDATNQKLKYAVRKNGSWQSQVVEAVGNLNQRTSIALDSHGNPHIAYRPGSSSWIRVASLSGSSWQFDEGEGGIYPSLAIGPDDVLHLAYWFGTLRYATWNGSAWDAAEVPVPTDVSEPISLVMDGSGRPRIVFREYLEGHNKLQYAFKDGATWSVEQIASELGYGGFAALTLDKNGVPYVTYSSGEFSKTLYLAHRTGPGSWNSQTVDASGDATDQSAVAVDTNGVPRVAYLTIEPALEYAVLAPVPTVGFNPTTYAIAESGGSAQITVALDAASPLAVQVDYANAGGNAVPGRDYTAVNDTVTIPSGQTSATFSVPVLNDPLDEADDSVTLILSNARQANLGVTSATLTIADDDPPPSDSQMGIETVEQGLYASEDLSIAVDGDGMPGVSFCDERDRLHFGRLVDGQWTFAVVDPDHDCRSNSLKFDSLGVPHIAYDDWDNDDLRYATLEGESWRTELVDGSTDIYDHVSLFIGGDDVAHISYHDDDNETLKHAYSSPTGWISETVDSTADVGDSSSIFVTADSYPHISYLDYTNDALKYASLTPTGWVSETVTVPGGFDPDPEHTSLAVDADGVPHIAYVDTYEDDVLYVYRKGPADWGQAFLGYKGESQWYPVDHVWLTLVGGQPYVAYHATDVDAIRLAWPAGDYATATEWNVAWVAGAAGAGGGAVNMAADAGGNLQVAYLDPTGAYPMYTSGKDGAWDRSPVQMAGRDVGLPNVLRLDANDQPHLAYFDVQAGALRYAHLESGQWISETVPAGAGIAGEQLSLGIDGSALPHIAYTFVPEAGSPVLRYAHYDGAKWVIRPVLFFNGDPVNGRYPSLAMDGDGNPHITFRDDAAGPLMYARWTGTKWDTVQVEGWPADVTHNSLALAADGTGRVAYYDAATGTLHYAVEDALMGWQEPAVVDASANVGQYPSLALDSAGRPNISYYDATNQTLKYARWDGLSWIVDTLPAPSGGGFSPASSSQSDAPVSSALPATLGASIGVLTGSHQKVAPSATAKSETRAQPDAATGDRVKMAPSIRMVEVGAPAGVSPDDAPGVDPSSISGPGAGMPIDAPSGDHGRNTSLALDASDWPMILAEFSPFGVPEPALTWWDGTTWQNSVLPIAAGSPSLAIDSLNQPSFSFHRYDTGDLTYLWSTYEYARTAQFSADSYSVDEGAGKASASITLNWPAEQDVTVMWQTSDGTARAGQDYTGGTNTATIPAGQSSATVEVPILPDTAHEGDETVQLILVSAAPAEAVAPGTPTTATLTIVDDDSEPQAVSAGFAQAQYTVAENAGSAAIAVKLSGPAPSGASVHYAATRGATPVAQGTLNFTAGSTQGTFTVPIADDTLDEADETLSLRLTAPVALVLGTSTASLTIQDNDPQPQLRFSAAAYRADEGTSATITVLLTAASGRTVTVAYKTANGTATAGDQGDYAAASGTLTFAPGTTSLTFAVPLRFDLVHDPDKTVQLSLSSPSNATLAPGGSSSVLTITDHPANKVCLPLAIK